MATENRSNNCKNQTSNRTSNQTTNSATNEHKHPNQYTKGADDEGGKNSAGIGGAVGALIAGAVLSLVLAVGAAFLTAIFHRIVAPFDFGRRSALPAHSLTGCGGFMHRSSKEVS